MVTISVQTTTIPIASLIVGYGVTALQNMQARIKLARPRYTED